MKKFFLYLILIIAAIGLLFNLNNVFNLIFNAVITLLIIAGILYAIYYFFILSEDERQYRKALRKTKRKRKFRD